MLGTIRNIRKSINKAYLKVKPNRSQIESFKYNLISYFNQIKKSESEEFHKNIIADFLKNTYYGQIHYINTKGRADLVIHNGKDSKSSVGVLIEAKKPSNKTEMPTAENLNAKAFHELVLYYLRERISDGNLEIKHLIATNNYEWFIFDANEFEKAFAKNKKLVAQFKDFEEGRLSGKTTDFFYNNIIAPFIDQTDPQISYTNFDLKDYKSVLDSEDISSIIPLYKIFSPEHLLKLPFINDSNTLDRGFYNELLHIIGLEEIKEKSKKIIRRKSGQNRDNGYLIENAIRILNYENCLSQIPNLRNYGEDKDEQLYNIALELVITWINRILFIKLLEGQLLRYHKGDPEFRFLDDRTVSNYDELNKLFFHVLAVKEEERNETVRKKFSRIPYLNSSLFEPGDIEQKTIRISNLDDDLQIPILTSTVLKDNTGKRIKGERRTLQYFLEFLDAYDFSGEGAEGIQEENKTLINASVLGLIFEKINGYKDGSFFTPGFITMYMCRETIRRAVVQKFNEDKGTKCESLDDLYNRIEDKKEANRIINSLKICDPAVGSGHFLVSALNEIIAIKSELKVLTDRNGRVLRDYHIEVVNDELVITDEDGKFFEYHPRNPESQRIQETLFHEKQTIIENCLFGVDINPNSVKICRLRLWIELLKNAYYKPDSGFTQLETLPNIDINIKCGNSLISRYPLDADIKTALAKSRWSIDSYRIAVMTYRNAENKEQKAEMRRLIDEIKSDFESEVSKSDKRFLRLNKLKGELTNLTGQNSLFELSQKEKSEWEKKVNKITSDIGKIEAELEDIRNNKVYEHAFEWRFEFPEVLNDEGEFIGFDVVIGNPPYGTLVTSDSKNYFKENFTSTQGPYEIYKFFIEKSFDFLHHEGLLCFITPDTWTNLSYFKKLRLYTIDNFSLEVCSQTLYDVFEEATVDNNIFIFRKQIQESHKFSIINQELNEVGVGQVKILDDDFLITTKVKPQLVEKIELNSVHLGSIVDIWRGMSAYGATNPNKPYNSYSKESEFHRPLLNGGDIGKYFIKWSGEYIKYGDWLHRPRPCYIYDSPHLLVQRIRNPRLKNRIIAAYDDQKFISSDGLSNILLKNPTQDPNLLKYLLAIINSRLINYWFSYYYFDVNIKPEQLRLIPIRTNEVYTSIVNLVNTILSIKQDDNNANTLNVEKSIEQKIYDLYGLTEEEIKIVEETVNDKIE